MAEHALVEQRAAGQQPAGGLDRYTVDPGAQERLKIDPLVGLQKQGKQEHFAELAVAFPGLPGPERLEGRHVDEHRHPVDELDVVGTGVFQDEVLVQGVFQQLQLQFGR